MCVRVRACGRACVCLIPFDISLFSQIEALLSFVHEDRVMHNAPRRSLIMNDVKFI